MEQTSEPCSRAVFGAPEHARCMTRLLGTLAVVLLLASGAGPVLASHAQTVKGWTLTCQSRNGNEWWVGAVVGGASASQVTRVEAMDTGGPWVELTKRAWGSWAASFHVEPGHTVRSARRCPTGRRSSAAPSRTPRASSSAAR